MLAKGVRDGVGERPPRGADYSSESGHPIGSIVATPYSSSVTRIKVEEP